MCLNSYRVNELPELEFYKCESTFLTHFGKYLPEVDKYKYVNFDQINNANFNEKLLVILNTIGEIR
jgi:hypothetical protein